MTSFSNHNLQLFKLSLAKPSRNFHTCIIISLKYALVRFVARVHKCSKARGGGGGAPLHGLYRYVRRQKVWFFSRFGHEWVIHFSHFAAILVINRVSILIQVLVLNCLFYFFFFEEATSSSCPPPSIHALPSSPPFNACYAG